MNDTARAMVKDYMRRFVERISRKAGDLTIEQIRRAFPFHDLFFRDEALVAFKLQRSIVTSMGRGFYPEIARLVAQERYSPQTEHLVTGEMDAEMCNAVERIVSELRTARRKPDHAEEMREILSSTGGGARPVYVIADLYIPDLPSGSLFCELKSPKPNLDVAAESKKKMLYYCAHCAVNGEKGLGVFALPYNPYVQRESYTWWPTLQVMDMDSEVLIGEEFWDLIGGSGTYETLMLIISEVKAEVRLARQDE